MEKKEITINSDELNIFKNMLNNLGDAINKFEKNYNKLSDSKYIQFNKIKINYLNKHLKIHFQKIQIIKIIKIMIIKNQII